MADQRDGSSHSNTMPEQFSALDMSGRDWGQFNPSRIDFRSEQDKQRSMQFQRIMASRAAALVREQQAQRNKQFSRVQTLQREPVGPMRAAPGQATERKEAQPGTSSANAQKNTGQRHTDDTVARYPTKEVSNAELGQLRPTPIDTRSQAEKASAARYAERAVQRGMAGMQQKAQGKSQSAPDRAAAARAAPARQAEHKSLAALQASRSTERRVEKKQERAQSRQRQQSKQQGKERGNGKPQGKSR